MADPTAEPDPELRHVGVWVCVLCLEGIGGECHSPGCLFFICPAPTAEQAERLNYHARVDDENFSRLVAVAELIDPGAGRSVMVWPDGTRLFTEQDIRAALGEGT